MKIIKDRLNERVNFIVGGVLFMAGAAMSFLICSLIFSAIVNFVK
jgi:hypothetical protein